MYQDLFSLKEKVVVVTGAAGILGKHFCRGLAAFGADVAVVDLDGAAATVLADELVRDYGVKSFAIGCDVSSQDSVMSMVSKTVGIFGAIDILLNNAASKSADLKQFFAPFEDYSLEEWRKIMAVNLDGMFLVAKVVGKQMVEQGTGGSIIQTASIYGVLAPDQRIYDGSLYLGHQINTPAIYSASKAGVLGLTRYLATYWAENGIRVNSITPGGVFSGQNDTFVLKYSARIPMGRMAHADELVGAVIYLASGASSYVTGQNLVVDGGLSAW